MKPSPHRNPTFIEIIGRGIRRYRARGEMNTKKKIGLIILFLIFFPIVVIYSIFNLGKLIVLEIIKFVIESANLFIEIISPKSGLASWFEKTKENI